MRVSLLGRAALVVASICLLAPGDALASCGDEEDWRVQSYDLAWDRSGLVALLPPEAQRVRLSEGTWSMLPSAPWSMGDRSLLLSGSPGRVVSVRAQNIQAPGCVATDIRLRVEPRLGDQPSRSIRIPPGYLEGLHVSPRGGTVALEMNEWWLDGDIPREHVSYMIVDLQGRRVVGSLGGAQLGWGPDGSVVVVDVHEREARWVSVTGAQLRTLASYTAPEATRLSIVRDASGSESVLFQEGSPATLVRPVRGPSGSEWQEVRTGLRVCPDQLHLDAGLALYIADPPLRATLRAVSSARIVARVVDRGGRLGGIFTASFAPSGERLAFLSYGYEPDTETAEEEEHEDATEGDDEEEEWPSSSAIDVFSLPCDRSETAHWGGPTNLACRLE